jgi:hypothetical protein
VIVVQQIHVVWTKQSRGGHGAQRRAAVPDRFPPPATATATAVPAATSGLVQRVRATEEQGFRAEVCVQPYPSVEEIGLGDVGLVIVGEQLRVVRLADTRPAVGFPPRGYERRLFELAVGQWGRVRANARHVAENHWWYEQVTTNIAFLGDGQALAQAFVSAPTVEVDQRVALR